MIQTPVRLPVTIAALALLLSACGGGSVEPEETRAQDSRTFTADATATTFTAMATDQGDVVTWPPPAAMPACWKALLTASRCLKSGMASW